MPDDTHPSFRPELVPICFPCVPCGEDVIAVLVIVTGLAVEQPGIAEGIGAEVLLNGHYAAVLFTDFHA